MQSDQHRSKPTFGGFFYGANKVVSVLSLKVFLWQRFRFLVTAENLASVRLRVMISTGRFMLTLR